MRRYVLARLGMVFWIEDVPEHVEPLFHSDTRLNWIIGPLISCTTWKIAICTKPSPTPRSRTWKFTFARDLVGARRIGNGMSTRFESLNLVFYKSREPREGNGPPVRYSGCTLLMWFWFLNSVFCFCVFCLYLIFYKILRLWCFELMHSGYLTYIKVFGGLGAWESLKHKYPGRTEKKTFTYLSICV